VFGLPTFLWLKAFKSMSTCCLLGNIVGSEKRNTISMAGQGTSLLVLLSVALDKKRPTNQATHIYSQAFVAIATSSGEIRTLTGKDPKKWTNLQFKKVKVNWE